MGTLRVLEAVRSVEKTCRIYQASTSELFGRVKEIPQNELTPFYPRSPYGVAKLYAYWITKKNYREAYGIFAVNGILSIMSLKEEGKLFVSRKITLATARINKGIQKKLYLGNLDSKRDWVMLKIM